jgi:uncharacterized membrane-anchored protein YitT (DUF2179 family)
MAGRSKRVIAGKRIKRRQEYTIRGGERVYGSGDRWAVSLRDFLYVLSGALFIALAVNWIFAPNKTVTGGVSGLGILLFYLLHVPIYWSTLLMNIPLFLAGLVYLGGRQFGLKTAVGILFLSLFLKWTTPLFHHPLTTNPLLASVFGGIILGIGIGTVFRGRATTGGTDLVARLVQRFTGRSPGYALLFIDGSIIAAAGVVFQMDRVLYALISLYITSRTIDTVQEGWRRAKVAHIISDQHEAIAERILVDLDRGLTEIPAIGKYSSEERPILMCVLHQAEVTRLKEMVRRIDPDAFIIVSNAHEVLGEGFQRY